MAILTVPEKFKAAHVYENLSTAELV